MADDTEMGAMRIDIELVRQLAAVLDETQLTEEDARSTMSPEGWSVLGIAEHVAVVERSLLNFIREAEPAAQRPEVIIDPRRESGSESLRRETQRIRAACISVDAPLFALEALDGIDDRIGRLVIVQNPGW